MVRVSTITRAFVLCAVLIAVGSGAWAAVVHLRLTKSYPEADQHLSTAPDTVRLWFSEEPELSVAAISIEGASGTVDVAKVEATEDAKSFRAKVIGELSAGSYRVTWRTAGSDGHVIRGRYDFWIDR